MIPVLQKLSGLYVWYALVVLTLGYLTAELGHFLIGVTSKATAVDIHYGDIACQWLPPPHTEYQKELSDACTAALDKITCENTTQCEWNYNGLGYDYQVLAGPSFIAVYTIAGIFLGVAADKYKRVPMVATCILIIGVSCLLIGASTEYWQLLVLRMVFAAGEAGLNPMSTGILSDLFPEHLRGLVMSLFNWGIYGGIGLSFPVGRYITELNAWGLGWRVAYYFSGIIALIVGVLAAISLKEPERTAIGEETEEQQDTGAKKESDSTWKIMLQPRFIMLCIAASIRHTGGLCFAYNCDLFYRDIFPHLDLGGWLFFVTFVVGGVGVIVGGIVSDKIVAKMGIKSRAAVLAISQLIATPFAFGSIYMGPVGAMITLAISYLFAEMWFGILFAILVEIVPVSVRSTTVGVFLFIMNNIGGNLPILMEPVRKATSFRDSLAIFYAGAYLISSVLFAITMMMMGKTKKETKNAANVEGVANEGFTSLENISRTNSQPANSRTIESHHL
ncbi:protein spinster homolog 1 [Nilaparvata lugens]|uniref:protein spinster homolog 1 n=1 Tax=Nilaparvata lugens TaxID=108931 RepID=UPI000B98E350|nr:protein spinster homolog 1 [Nilaparvata lugens]XP_039298653.1 protein spinster homolog 1 [Nilaparvata lugens]